MKFLRSQRDKSEEKHNEGWVKVQGINPAFSPIFRQILTYPFNILKKILCFYITRIPLEFL